MSPGILGVRFETVGFEVRWYLHQCLVPGPLIEFHLGVARQRTLTSERAVMHVEVLDVDLPQCDTIEIGEFSRVIGAVARDLKGLIQAERRGPVGQKVSEKP